MDSGDFQPKRTLKTLTYSRLRRALSAFNNHPPQRLQKRVLFEFSLCLSRACLGKLIICHITRHKRYAKNAPAAVKAEGTKAAGSSKSAPAPVKKAVAVKDNKTNGKAALVKSTSTHRQIKAPKNVVELVSASRKMFRAIKAHASKGGKKH